jgi:hypothetical protein
MPEAVLVTVVVEIDVRRMVLAAEDGAIGVVEAVLGDGVGMDVDVAVGATYTVAVELSTHPIS